MEVTTSQAQGRVPVTIFHVKGRVTEYEPLQQRAQEAFDSGTRNLVLDLTDVPYMASPGLRALHAMYILFRTAEESGEVVSRGIAAGTYMSPHLKLVNPSEHVADILRMTGYDMFLEIHPDLKSAIASF